MDRPRGTVLVVRIVVGAGPAIYEQAVVKSERAGFGGLIPTVYSASRAVAAPSLVLRRPTSLIETTWHSLSFLNA
jgi:hypothetical protein